MTIDELKEEARSMLIALSNQFILHFFFGVSLVTLFTIPVFRAKKRRYLFHFGGDSPMTLGSKPLWATWYTVALLLEIVTSLLTHSVYIEFALSIYQAIAFVAGAFIVDRFTMMWEPSNMYSSGLKVITTKPVSVTETVNPSVSEVTLLPPVDVSSSSWLGNFFKRMAKKAVKAPQKIAHTVTDTVVEYRDEVAVEKKAEQEKRERESAERRKRFRDIIDGH